MSRGRAVVLSSVAVFLVALPPTINNHVFIPWDLTFGSGMQTLGALVAVLTVGWCVDRSEALKQLGSSDGRPVPIWLFYWIRFGIPVAIITAGVWWVLSNVIGTVKAV
jgi:SNF family Na+-dependent transporter